MRYSPISRYVYSIIEIICLDLDIINKYGHKVTIFKKTVLTLKLFRVRIKNKLMWVCKKPPPALLPMSPTWLPHSTLLTHLVTNCVAFFPHTKQFSTTPAGCPTVWLNSDSLPGESTRSHRLGAQSHETASSPFRRQLQVQVVTCASDQLAIGQRFHDVLFGFH